MFPGKDDPWEVPPEHGVRREGAHSSSSSLPSAWPSGGPLGSSPLTTPTCPSGDSLAGPSLCFS